jgi:pimeloyl-ACP methyl ester carboxylesterase
MDFTDDDLTGFEQDGPLPLPAATDQGFLEQEGARIWYRSYGFGSPVILLHGGLGHGGNWSYQVPALLERGYRVILIDTRGHGRSTHDERPYSYELLATDVFAVMDALGIDKAALVGWSDGATTALIMAMRDASRVSGVFFFACNMDPSGVKPFEFGPVMGRCFNRHSKDYAQLSATPAKFKEFVDAVSLMMNTQHDCTAEQLAAISVPVVIVQSENDEFIKPEHAEYLARTIPDAGFVFLGGVSHFAPLQRPAQFNAAMLAFLDGLPR